MTKSTQKSSSKNYLRDTWENIPKHIKKYGCTVLAIAGEGESPPFAYTVGLHEAGFPALLTIALPQTTAHHILMSAYTRMKESGWEAPEDGDILSGVTNAPLVFKDVAPGNDMTLWAFDYYPNEEVKVLQICWPDKAGLFPNQPGFDSRMRQDVQYAKPSKAA